MLLLLVVEVFLLLLVCNDGFDCSDEFGEEGAENAICKLGGADRDEDGGGAVEVPLLLFGSGVECFAIVVFAAVVTHLFFFLLLL